MRMERDEAEFERGETEATSDLANGHPKLYWQTRGKWGDLMTQWMAERFSITVEHTSDMVTVRQTSYWDGYNQVIVDHVNKTFGNGSFKSVLDEIDEYRQESYRRYLQENPPESA